MHYTHPYVNLKLYMLWFQPLLTVCGSGEDICALPRWYT